MKKFFICVSLFIGLATNAQNVGIGTNHPASKLHVAGDIRIDSLAKEKGIVLHDQEGVLRSVKLTGRKQDVLRGDGTFSSLNSVAATSASWLTTGNTGVDTAINFLGTIDNQSLKFRVNNRSAAS